MSRTIIGLCAVLLVIICAGPSLGQQAAVMTSSTNGAAIVPPLVSFNGVLTDLNGKPISGVTGVTFALYKDEQGSAPLWLETQNVYPDRTGHYTVLLGSTTSTGLPTDLFAAGEARWLGVEVQGQSEQPRILLASAPYALKAADAQTIGGLPASAFVLAAPPVSSAAPATASGSAVTSNATSATTSDVTTSGGTANTIPLFTTATNIQNSILTQTSTTAINVGGKLNLPALGTATSSAGFNSEPLDFIASVYNSTSSAAVPQTFQWQAEALNNDKTTATGTLNLLYGSGTTTPAETGVSVSSAGVLSTHGLSLLAMGAASSTSTAGYTSRPLDLYASSWDTSGTPAAVSQHFRWQAEPAGSDTASPSGTMNLLYGSGTATPAETGLKISSKGLLTFAAGQTFPGTGTGDGSVTSVGTGVGLTGGAITTTGTLAIDPTVVPQLNVANTFTGNQTVNGNLSATGVVTGAGFNIGSYLFASGSFANSNVFLGFSGNTSLTGADNTATGMHAMVSDTTGMANTASGVVALYANTTGSYNTATGAWALYQNTTGTENTATGYNALNSNTTGGGNVAMGAAALLANNTGYSNTASGAYALTANTTGTNNTADGYYALQSMTTGGANTAVGNAALYQTTTGGADTAGGAFSLQANTTGGENTALGYLALQYNTTGSNNTALGYNAGPDSSSTNLTYAAAIGANAVVSESNALVLGGTGGSAVNVGIGTAKPAYTLDVHGTGNFTGVVNFASGQTFPGTGSGTITGVTAGTGLSGGGTSGAVTLNNTGILGVTAGTGITSSGGQTPTIGINTSVVPQLAAANTFTGAQTINNNVSITATGTAATILGTGSGSVGLWGKGAWSGVYGDSTSSNGYGVYGSGNFGIYGSGGNYGVYGSGSMYGAYGQFGETTSTTGAAFGQSSGVWGDGGSSNIGVIGTTDDSYAGYFEANNSSYYTLVVNNLNSSGTPFYAGNAAGNFCLVDSGGDLHCTGSSDAVVPVDGGQRAVGLSAIESPKNWFEDFGSAQLSKGSAVVPIEPQYLKTVNTEVEYHVFLTPDGDCKGLYVSQRTPTSFEVRELGGGTSNIEFSYRIVALRRNYENIRMADHTDDLNSKKMMKRTGAPFRFDTLKMRPPERPAPLGRLALQTSSVKANVSQQ